MFTEVSPCGLLPVAKHDLGMFDSWRLLKLRDTPLNLWQTKILKNYENEGRGLSSTHPIIITLRLSWSWSFLVFLADNLVQELEVTIKYGVSVHLHRSIDGVVLLQLKACHLTEYRLLPVGGPGNELLLH